jgi:pimeloyl-ACP methyl ester carboxylesterase
MRRLTLGIALCALATLLTACASPLSRLPSEHDVPRLATLVEQAHAFQNHTYLEPTQIAGETPVRLAVHETGGPTPGRIVVLVHGVFTDSTTWRYIQGALVGDHELWLIDLPGCGESDVPSPADLPQHGYSPEQLAERVLQALDARLSLRDDNPSIALVGHSLGGQIAIQMTTDPRLTSDYENVVQRIDRVALLSPADVEIEEPDPLFLELIDLPGWKVGLGATFGVLQRKVATGTLDGAANRDFAVREHAESRIAILTDPPRRRAMQAMLRDSVPSIDYKELDRDAIAREVADYERLSIPCIIVWGKRDDTLPVATGFKLAAELPTAELIVFNDSKHGVHHDEPELCAQLLASFIETGYAQRDLQDGVTLAVQKRRNFDAAAVPVLLGK